MFTYYQRLCFAICIALPLIAADSLTRNRTDSQPAVNSIRKSAPTDQAVIPAPPGKHPSAVPSRSRRFRQHIHWSWATPMPSYGEPLQIPANPIPVDARKE
jgi:hypothetical protein